MQFGIITKRAFFRLDIIVDEFRLRSSYSDLKIGNQFFIGSFESISKLQMNADAEDDDDIAANQKKNYTFSHFSLAKPSKK